MLKILIIMQNTQVIIEKALELEYLEKSPIPSVGVG
jgi:hypothetical protein